MASEVRYPHVLAAVKKHEGSQWAIGDALVQDCPKGKLDKVAEELRANGFEYDSGTLYNFRLMASRFNANSRRREFGFEVHKEAGSPKILEAAIAAAKEKGVEVSKRFVRAYVASLESEEHRAQRRKHEKAKMDHEDAEAERAAARKAKQQAKDAAARERAERKEREAEEKAERAKEKVRETKPVPEKKAPREPATEPLAITKLEFSSRLSQVVGLTRAMKKQITPVVDELPKNWVNATVEELLEAADNLRKLADLIRKNQPNARGHLAVVA